MSTASFTDAGVQGIRLTKKKRVIKGVPRVAGTHTKEDYWVFRGLNASVSPGEILTFVSRDLDRTSCALRVWAGLLPLDAGQVQLPKRSLLLSPAQARWVRELSVEQTIRMLAGTYGLNDHEVEDLVIPAARAAQVESMLHWPLAELEKGYRDQIAFAVAVNAPVEMIMFDQTGWVGTRDFRPLCLNHLKALRDAGKAVVVGTIKPNVVLEVGSRAVILRGKRSQEVSVAEAAEFLIKDRVKGRKKARRRAEEDDDDSGLEF